MRRFIHIVIFSALFSLQLAAQKVDTLYSGLKKASSFIVLNETIYVVESGNHRVLKLDLDGKLIEKYGNRGGGNYQFDNPVSIASSTGLKIFISDLGNNRIQVFDKRWQYLSSITGNKKFQTKDEIEPSYLGVNKLGEIIFYDAKSKSFGRYNEDGTYLDQIPIPSEIKSVQGFQVSGDKLFILDNKSGFVHRLSGNGFYETFYPAKGVSNFQFVNGKMILVQIDKMNMSQLNSSDSRVIAIENPTQGIFKNEKFLYLLTSKELIRVALR